MTQTTEAAASVLEVGALDIEAKWKVTAPLTGATERSAHGRRYIPRSISVGYTRRPDGTWRSVVPALHGLQVRKDGTTGTREISEWFLREPLTPAWVLDFVDANNPKRR